MENYLAPKYNYGTRKRRIEVTEHLFSLSSSTSEISLALDKKRGHNMVMEERSSVSVMQEEESEFLHEEAFEPPSSGELAFSPKKASNKSTKR